MDYYLEHLDELAEDELEVHREIPRDAREAIIKEILAFHRTLLEGMCDEDIEDELVFVRNAIKEAKTGMLREIVEDDIHFPGEN